MKWVFLYLVTCGVALGQQSIEELSQMLLDDFDKRANASAIVPEKMKGDVTDYVRDVRDDKVYGNHVSARVLLVNLGDRKYMQELVGGYRGEDIAKYQQASATLGRSSQVELTPLLHEFFELDDGIFYQPVATRLFMSRSVGSSMIVLANLSRSPDVPLDVQQWTKENMRKMGEQAVHCRTVVRRWWEENKQHFETKEYHKLRPLDTDLPTEEPQPTQTVEAPTSVSAPKPLPEPVHTATPTTNDTAENTNDKLHNRSVKPLWFIVLIIFFLVPFSILITKRKRGTARQ